MRKPIVAFGAILTLSICLMGCGNAMPAMTEEQSDAISEYATSLLLKYDTEDHSRLVDAQAILDKYDKAWEDYNEAKAKYEKQLAKEEKKKAQEEKEKAEETVVDKSSDSSTSNGGATIIDTMSIGQFLGVDYDITYSDYSLVKSYPEDGTDYFFSMEATSGHNLLVVKLNATNNNSVNDTLDIMSKNLTFKLSVNGESFHASYKTMLEDDFSEYLGDFKAGESKTVVLVAEVEEGKDVSSIDLRISDTNGNVITKQLLK